MDAGKSTHNRLELGKEHDESEGNRYSKISWDEEKIEDLFCQIFLESFNVKAIFVGGTAGRMVGKLIWGNNVNNGQKRKKYSNLDNTHFTNECRPLLCST